MDNKKNCLLPFALFSVLSAVVVLKFVGLVKLFGNLCEKVPADREYCKNTTANLSTTTLAVTTTSEGLNATTNDTDTHGAQGSYIAFQFMNALSIFIDLMALCTVCSRIYICVADVCVPMCYKVWKLWFACGRGWAVLTILSAFIILPYQCILGSSIQTADLSYIDGFYYCLAGLIIGTLLVIGWSIYTFKYGCPPSDYFLGSDKVFSDFEVSVIERQVRETKVRRDGTVVYEYKTKKTYTLLPRVREPVERIEHI